MEVQLVVTSAMDRIGQLVETIRQGLVLPGVVAATGRNNSNLVRHQEEWNKPDGIRAQAVDCGVLTEDEGGMLMIALLNWAGQPRRVQQAVNQLMNLLFCIRKNPTFAMFDRAKLTEYAHLSLKSKRSRRNAIERRAVRRRGLLRSFGGGW